MSVPYVTINLDGLNRPLRYNAMAFADLEDQRKEPIGAILTRLSDNDGANAVSYSVLRDLIWAGLKWKDRTMTPQKAIQLISDYEDNGGEIITLWETIWKALERSGLIQSMQAKVEADDVGEVAEGNAQTEILTETTQEVSQSSPSTSGSTQPSPSLTGSSV